MLELSYNRVKAQKSVILSNNMVGGSVEGKGWGLFMKKVRFEPDLKDKKNLGRKGREF